MKKYYRYVFTIDGEIACSKWKDMKKASIFDLIYNAALNNKYINGDTNSTWHMDFKDVDENEKSND